MLSPDINQSWLGTSKNSVWVFHVITSNHAIHCLEFPIIISFFFSAYMSVQDINFCRFLASWNPKIYCLKTLHTLIPKWTCCIKNNSWLKFWWTNSYQFGKWNNINVQIRLFKYKNKKPMFHKIDSCYSV